MKKSFREKLIKSLTYSALLLTVGSSTIEVSTVLATPGDKEVKVLEEKEESIMELIHEQEVTITELVELIRLKEEEVMVLKSEVEEKEEEVKEIQKEIDAKNDEIKKLGKVIKQTEEKLEEQIKLYEKNIEKAEERARSLQKEDSDKASMYISAFLQADNFSEMVGRLHAVNVILEAHEQQILDIEEQAEEIENTRDALDKSKKEIIKERDKIAEMQKEVKEEQADLVEEKEEIDKIVNELDAEKKEMEKLHDGSLDELFSTQETKNGLELMEQMKQMEEERRRQNGSVTTSASNASAIKDALADIRSRQGDSSIVKTILNEGQKQLGVPYLWGGTTTSGFDCSGLTQHVYAKAGIKLPRVSSAQAKVGQSVPLNQAQPGDLLFWDKGGKVYHVAIYIGGGDFIHAPRPGKSVNITNVKHFTPSSARRVVPAQKTSRPSNSSYNSVSKGGLIGTFSATSYAIGTPSVPSTVTANGTDISNTIHTKDGHRIIAVDTNVIPMNSVVVVDIPGQETFTAKASDTGSAIKGNIIDVLVDSPSKARNFGRKQGIKIYRKK